MKLYVVILCYRVPELTIDCLRSLAPEIGRVPGMKVGVCENGTGPEAAEMIRRAIEENGWGPWCELTAISPNRGFCGGNNILIREALEWADPPEYVYLLNADTIVQPRALEILVDFMDHHPRAGIAGGRFLSPEGEVQCSPFRFHSIASELDRGLRLGPVSRLLARSAVVPPPPSSDCQADWVSGAGMMLRRSMLDEIGLLDEGLYTYFDDADICMRARRAGWEVWHVPESRIVHLEGASTGVVARVQKRRPAYWFQARRRYYLKHHGPFYAAAADAAFLTGFALWRLRRWASRRPDTDPPHYLRDSFRHSVFGAGFQVEEVQNPALVEQPLPAETFA
ncbi:N-acetylglucosaminyl-diphospho-decaprenol L-rhamnosyltransferase [Aquisphaera giovannonii]|uniref:N-acetylglucosaminyl-diphospho-decaprenol L-rhamnosyltransferase n=1 Tax=Aquisphaera giovannonii TaxID=406548 RepID=A0A5B9W0L1_9BACT|nr:glycosyltransferase family 2 protein [Aquisphaera giovannonii]QEH34182.1 N-acetylglucosaminyl-diphospho-decaprenol L-rhamnosyltransferase [Aquisphaera giovannonii]